MSTCPIDKMSIGTGRQTSPALKNAFFRMIVCNVSLLSGQNSKNFQKLKGALN